MTDRQPPCENAVADADPSAWGQEALRRQVALLERLSESGLRMALAIERRLTEAAPEAALSSDALAKEAMAFSRAARTVRVTALLQSRLIKDAEQLRLHTAAEAEERAEEKQRLQPVYRHKARVERIVERLAIDQCDEDTIECVIVEAGERLDDEDLYGDIMTRPVGELVALLCRDLGLEPDWDRLSEEAWAKQEIASGAEASPFRTLFSQRPPPLAGEGDREGVEGACRTAAPAAVAAALHAASP